MNYSEEMRSEKNKIGITKAMAINSLGLYESTEDQRYTTKEHSFDLNTNGDWKASVSTSLWNEINGYIQNLGHKPERFPEEAKLLSYLIHKMDLQPSEGQMINAATSRGSIDFLSRMQQENPNLPVWTSPHSTLGFASSWPSLLHESDSSLFFQSSTCSSFGLTLQNAFAWLNSGMADSFIAAAVECPTGQLTIDQMKAIRIYANGANNNYPCRSMDFEKEQNTMVLGEGAYVFELKKTNNNILAYLDGVGSAVEKIHHSTELSSQGNCIVTAAKRAFNAESDPNIDLIIGHFPGTKLGDIAEKNAYQTVFGNKIPYTISNKWKIGHSLGSSLAANLDLAISILQNQELPPLPDYIKNEAAPPKTINRILITALGFGGQAICAVIEK
ncbi:beta-ketoacyl synthase N-terminal-like domain-containing protein [Echinicola marina]|uniref:beta-ketoacyl synthase N-terminal-like domain-containing protein n=1 Tax=Echinicola marina TaxID=2859768 RepID=UPI001CF6A1B6|nr:beta-ketoacyl synthase N-terminal-like domain-containing protein [Echinicola marina]